jgi:hypothetical protein
MPTVTVSPLTLLLCAMLSEDKNQRVQKTENHRPHHRHDCSLQTVPVKVNEDLAFERRA